PVELAFVSPDQTTIVPELRWLPLNNTATVAAKELLAGPSSWLADAVVTRFPAGAALDVESVVVEDNVASVALTPESAGSPADRALLEQQLRVTLTSLPHVNNVYISVAGLPLSGDGSVSLSR